MMKALDELNEAQRKAVIETEGFIRLTAGAGSGKSETLYHSLSLSNGYDWD